jgi:hypothetical protein
MKDLLEFFGILAAIIITVVVFISGIIWAFPVNQTTRHVGNIYCTDTKPAFSFTGYKEECIVVKK